MDYSEILASILEMYAEELKSSHAAQAIREKVENGIYRYEDAEDLAREISRILGDAFGRYLPEALTNGRLYREAADIVVECSGKEQDEIVEFIRKKTVEK